MDFEDTVKSGMVGYDEKTETWYVRARESQRLMLTRRSFQRLIELYNGIHQGRPLVLLERRELDRLEAAARESTGPRRDPATRRRARSAARTAAIVARILANLLPRRR